MQSIEELPEHESPELFGMHPNVDLTFRKLQVQEAIQVILDTQPQGPNSDGRSSIEVTVDGLCSELLTKARPSSHHEIHTVDNMDDLVGTDPLESILHAISNAS